MLKDYIKVTGNLRIRKFDEQGNLIDEQHHKNLVVETGRLLIASRLFADTRPALVTTGGSATGTSATLTFASQPVIPYEVGNVIQVSGVIPTSFNGQQRVTAVSNDSVSYDMTSAPTVVTTNGQIDSLFNGTIKTMRVGFGSTSPNVSDTDLLNQAGSAPLFSSGVATEVDEVFIAYIALFPPGVATAVGGTGSLLQEAGLFNENNRMLCRTVFPPITKSAGESLEIFWKLTIA